MNMPRLAVATALLLVLALPAPAQDGPTGIAFVEAPEQSSGVCTGGNPDKAFACAREKCVAGGAEARDCARVAWCFPGGWSADVFVQHREGPHWHEYLCGWDSREAVSRAAEIKCDRTLRDYLIECATVRFWDPDGQEIEAN